MLAVAPCLLGALRGRAKVFIKRRNLALCIRSPNILDRDLLGCGGATGRQSVAAAHSGKSTLVQLLEKPLWHRSPKWIRSTRQQT